MSETVKPNAADLFKAFKRSRRRRQCGGCIFPDKLLSHFDLEKVEKAGGSSVLHKDEHKNKI